MIYCLVRLLLTIPVFLVYRPVIKGYRHLFFKGPAIIVANHWSAADPVYIAMISPRNIHFLAKADLTRSKWMEVLFKSMLTFPVEERDANITTIRKSLQELEKGHVLGVFPEGHRSVTGRIDTLQTGSAFLALRAGVPVIPIYVDPNTTKKLRIRMNVGAPIDCKEAVKLYGGKPARAVSQAIHDALLRLELEQEGICGS